MPIKVVQWRTKFVNDWNAVCHNSMQHSSSKHASGQNFRLCRGDLRLEEQQLDHWRVHALQRSRSLGASRVSNLYLKWFSTTSRPRAEHRAAFRVSNQLTTVPRHRLREVRHELSKLDNFSRHQQRQKNSVRHWIFKVMFFPFCWFARTCSTDLQKQGDWPQRCAVVANNGAKHQSLNKKPDLVMAQTHTWGVSFFVLPRVAGTEDLRLVSIFVRPNFLIMVEAGFHVEQFKCFFFKPCIVCSSDPGANCRDNFRGAISQWSSL